MAGNHSYKAHICCLDVKRKQLTDDKEFGSRRDVVLEENTIDTLNSHGNNNNKNEEAVRGVSEQQKLVTISWTCHEQDRSYKPGYLLENSREKLGKKYPADGKKKKEKYLNLWERSKITQDGRHLITKERNKWSLQKSA